jgi:hypothetical protein
LHSCRTVNLWSQCDGWFSTRKNMLKFTR